MAYERYSAASNKVQELHNGSTLDRNDAALVKPGAEHHGVDVVPGDIFTLMSDGDYNPRLPLGTEGEKVQKAKRMIVVCEDYRQSADVISDPEIGFEDGDIVFATAGGPVQPDKERMNADVEWINSVIELNPSILIIFVHHLRVCGGANYFTGKLMEKIFKDGAGANDEANKMNQLAQIILNGVESTNIMRYVSVIDENEDYVGLRKLD